MRTYTTQRGEDKIEYRYTDDKVGIYKNGEFLGIPKENEYMHQLLLDLEEKAELEVAVSELKEQFKKEVLILHEEFTNKTEKWRSIEEEVSLLKKEVKKYD